MQFQKVFYRYVTTPDSNATVAMGADSAPTTVYGTPGTPPQGPGAKAGANVDNVLSCRIVGASEGVVQRIAVAMCGPTGAAAPTGNLYVWDASSQHWYLVNSAAVTLTLNEVVFFDAVSLCDLPPSTNSANGSVAQGGADYMLVVTAAQSPTAGQYSFSMSAVLNTP
jgi:hypothetical protein